MLSLTIFDMLILGITLFLGLKGLLRGFIKEVFGIIAIIGSIFIASRVSVEIGNLIAPILGLTGKSSISLLGFIIALIGFWLIIYLIGMLVSNILSVSGLGIFDRILGYVFGCAKVFMILSVIIYAICQVNSFKIALNKHTEGSIIMPYLQGVGSTILKLDTTKITDTIEKSADSIADTTKDLANKLSEDNKDIKNNTIENNKNVEDKATDTNTEDSNVKDSNLIEDFSNKASEITNEVKENMTNDVIKDTIDKAKEEGKKIFEDAKEKLDNNTNETKEK